MCIACRNREPQHTLIRIQFEGGRVIPYRGQGRSSYICRACSQNTKRIKQLSKRFRIEEEAFVKLLKECYTDG
ncbi:DUF448 domain-containing protein [Nitratifractor sp.]|uniref:DUF448 domain-containing protein n=1 Tax=Nitratifractor sp. TaxID=2268144 RepID=UPI0025E84D95|nr:DUF448 domain-containing protein [Nitratifractor sp.]